MRPGNISHCRALTSPVRGEGGPRRRAQRSKISVTKTPAGWRWIDLSPETADMVIHYADNMATANKHDLVFPTGDRQMAVDHQLAEARLCRGLRRGRSCG